MKNLVDKYNQVIDTLLNLVSLFICFSFNIYFEKLLLCNITGIIYVFIGKRYCESIRTAKFPPFTRFAETYSSASL